MAAAIQAVNFMAADAMDDRGREDGQSRVGRCLPHSRGFHYVEKMHRVSKGVKKYEACV